MVYCVCNSFVLIIIYLDVNVYHFLAAFISSAFGVVDGGSFFLFVILLSIWVVQELYNSSVIVV